MTNEEAIKELQESHDMMRSYNIDESESRLMTALNMAIQALSQVSEIEENIIKYMKKYPNHVGNIDFWEGFYACRNVVLQLDDEEYAPKEQEPCDDLFKKAMKSLDFAEWVASEIMPDIEWINNRDAFPELACRRLEKLGIVEEKNGMWVRKERTNETDSRYSLKNEGIYRIEKGGK